MHHIELDDIQYTPTGLVQLLADEQRITFLEDAEVKTEECKLGPNGTDIRGCHGRVELTSKRFIWLETGSGPKDRKRSCSISLACVQGVAMSTGFKTAIRYAPIVKIQVGVASSRPAATKGPGQITLRVSGARAQVHGFKDRLEGILSRPSSSSGAGSGAAEATGSGGPATGPAVDALALEQLTTMGFSRDRARLALQVTKDDSSAAVEWLVTRQHVPVLQLEQEARASVASDDFTAAAAPGAAAGAPSPPTASSYAPVYPVISFANPSFPVAVAPGAARPGGGGGASSAAPPPAARPPPRTGPVGIEAVVEARRQRMQQIGHDVHRGFKDLEALKESGAKLAKLAEDLRNRTAAASGEDALDGTLTQQLLDLGIISPVTKSSAGKQYHDQLARELAELLMKHLPQVGGMMVLHDAYCVFNRARGLELVSPHDLRAAVELFEKLKLPVGFREFPSGVGVVQDSTWSDAEACVNIADTIANASSAADAVLGPGMSVVQYALDRKVPLAVAREQLLLAEREGVLCRDDSPEGLFFYRNFFAEVSG